MSYLSANPDLDGLLTVNEKFALMAIKLAQKMGRKVPQDLKVIGFTDGVLSKYSIPGLSTVSQHGKELGIRSAEILIDRLEEEEGEMPYQHIVVETELIERGSTRIE
jgi:LacI family transcriptional regulator